MDNTRFPMLLALPISEWTTQIKPPPLTSTAHASTIASNYPTPRPDAVTGRKRKYIHASIINTGIIISWDRTISITLGQESSFRMQQNAQYRIYRPTASDPNGGMFANA